MIIVETIKRKTTGAHRIFTEKTKITSDRLIRDQILNMVKANAIGSEMSAINQGDLYTINAILKRLALYTA